jgi:hypothetical protein
MPLEIDWYNNLILVTSPDTDIDAQTLHDFIEDAMASPEGLSQGDIIQPEGKIEDPASPGVYSQIIMVINSPWQIQFWGGSGYTRIYGAKIVGGLSDQPIKATGTAGDITVLESPVDGVTVASSSTLTATDKEEIAEAVMAAEVETGVTVEEAWKVITAALAGKVSGAETTNIKFRDLGDTKNVIDATVDSDGNRLSVTLDTT